MPSTIITVDEQGVILSVETNVGDMDSRQDVEFYGGILIPGMSDCHSHIEYSYVKGMIPRGGGLPEFIRSIIKIKYENATPDEEKLAAALKWSRKLHADGVVAVGDHNNNDYVYPVKQKGGIFWRTFVELFDVDGQSDDETFLDGLKRAEHHRTLSLPASVIPHACYTMTDGLMALTGGSAKAHCGASADGIVSIHYKESVELGGEKERERVLATLGENRDGVLLVHCIYANEGDIDCMIEKFGDKLTVVPCPLSNIYIENKLADIDMLRRKGVRIAIGTDSLSSNDTLSMIEEMKCLQKHLPHLPLEEILGWATINGAEALGITDFAGSFEVGKRPGIVQLENVDLKQMKLTDSSTSRRIV